MATIGIDLERKDGIGIATLCNPSRRNAFTVDMRRQLTAGLKDFIQDASIRAIVLRGEGEYFCSGADVSGPPPVRTLLQHRENNKEIGELAQALAAGPKPVIAAVEGAAAGAGMGMAVACDVIVAARNAKFVPLFTRLGLVPEIGILHTLAQRVGASRARRILMASTPVSAEEGLEIGLVDELVEPGQTFEKALAVAHAYDDCVPLAVAIVKEAYAQGVPSLAAAGRIEVDFVPMLVRTEDTREGIAASREKRRPKFTGN